MPCPPQVAISGSDSVTVSYQASLARATSRAMAAVPGAAQAAAIRDIVENQRCPPNCPFPAPFNIVFTITGTTGGSQELMNLLIGWLNWLLGDGWFYTATTTFDWRATANCMNERPSFLVTGVEAVAPTSSGSTGMPGG